MEVSAPELAAILGITDRQVRNLADQGVMAKLEHGRYALAESVQGFVRHRTRTALARVQRDPGENRVSELRAEELKLRIIAKEGALARHAREEAIGLIDAYLGPLKADLFSIPARVTKDLPLRRRMEAEITGAFAAAHERLAAAAAAAEAEARGGAAA